MEFIKNKLFSLTLTAFLISGIFLPVHVDAANVDCSKDLSPAGQQLFCAGQSGALQANSNTTNDIINSIANWFMGILGTLLAITILISAIQIISSAGSPNAVKSAKGRLAQAAISLGLLISFRSILALIGI